MELDERDRELPRRAAALSREAEQVPADLGLPGLVAAVGRGERVGSASFRLAILRLRDAGMRDGRYGPDGELHGNHIYEAVLDRGVRRYEHL